MSALLAVSDLTVRFGGVTALDRVSVEVAAASVHSIVGPNGAGKTTLFNTISGLNRSASGSIRYGDVELLGLRPARIARLGVTRTFQNVVLFEGMTVVENVLLGTERIRGLRVLPGRKEAIGLLERLGIGSAAEKKPQDIPYGTRKLVELARALISAPDLVMLDEPTAGVQEDELSHLVAFITHFQTVAATTFLLVAHHMDFVMKVSDRITVLQFGEKIAEGDPDAVQHDPSVITAYLGTPVVT